MNETDYEKMLKKLVVMDEKQLLNLYQDMLMFGTMEDIERVADCAYYFTENEGAIQVHTNKNWIDANKNVFKLSTVNNPTCWDTEDICSSAEEPEEVDWKRQDDAQRYRDIKST